MEVHHGRNVTCDVRFKQGFDLHRGSTVSCRSDERQMSTRSVRIDSGAIVVIGFEDSHERQSSQSLTFAWIKQNHRDVGCFSVQVSEQC